MKHSESSPKLKDCLSQHAPVRFCCSLQQVSSCICLPSWTSTFVDIYWEEIDDSWLLSLGDPNADAMLFSVLDFWDWVNGARSTQHSTKRWSQVSYWSDVQVFKCNMIWYDVIQLWENHNHHGYDHHRNQWKKWDCWTKTKAASFVVGWNFHFHQPLGWIKGVTLGWRSATLSFFEQFPKQVAGPLNWGSLISIAGNFYACRAGKRLHKVYLPKSAIHSDMVYRHVSLTQENNL